MSSAIVTRRRSAASQRERQCPGAGPRSRSSQRARAARVGEHAIWDEPVTLGAVPAAQISRDNAKIVERNVGELCAPGAITNRPDIGRARLEPVVDRYISSGIERDTGEVKPDPVCVGRASGRDQDIAAFDSLIACWRAHLETDRVSGSALYTENLDPKMHL